MERPADNDATVCIHRAQRLRRPLMGQNGLFASFPDENDAYRIVTMTQVFLSHAEEDTEHAVRLAADLRSAAVNVWMAPDSIRAGETFVSAIDRGLASSDYFAVLLSPAALASHWVRTEIEAAIDRANQGAIVLLPLTVRSVAVPPLLATFQRLDFTNYERGLALLAGILGVRLNPGVHAWPTGETQSASETASTAETNSLEKGSAL